MWYTLLSIQLGLNLSRHVQLGQSNQGAGADAGEIRGDMKCFEAYLGWVERRTVAENYRGLWTVCEWVVLLSTSLKDTVISPVYPV